MPSGLVRMVPPPPTTQNCVPLHVAARRLCVVPLVRDVQVMPSGLVRMVPPPPTTQNCVPLQVTPVRLCVVPLTRCSQCSPSTGAGRLVSAG